jgi:hypothetical protein
MSQAMLLVLAVAVDFGVVRHVLSGPPDSMPIAAVGVLLAANVLACGAYRLITSRESRRPFLVGAVVVGLAAVVASLAYAWLAPDSFRGVAMMALNPVQRALESAIPRAMLESEWLGDAIGVTAVSVLFGLPIFAIAGLGGMLCTFMARSAGADPPADRPPAEGSE